MTTATDTAVLCDPCRAAGRRLPASFRVVHQHADEAASRNLCDRCRRSGWADVAVAPLHQTPYLILHADGTDHEAAASDLLAEAHLGRSFAHRCLLADLLEDLRAPAELVAALRAPSFRLRMEGNGEVLLTRRELDEDGLEWGYEIHGLGWHRVVAADYEALLRDAEAGGNPWDDIPF